MNDEIKNATDTLKASIDRQSMLKAVELSYTENERLALLSELIVLNEDHHKLGNYLKELSSPSTEFEQQEYQKTMDERGTLHKKIESFRKQHPLISCLYTLRRDGV